MTTAEKLAERAFYVIVYDRRGEGRSLELSADYTFAQTVADIDTLYNTYGIESATLLGHSFGGVIASLYAEQHEDRVRSIVFIDAPLSIQASLRNIIDRSRDLYTETNDTVNLNYLRMIEVMDTASIMYSGYTLMHAMQNGFYEVASPNESANELYATVKRLREDQSAPSRLNMAANAGFFNNEHYTVIDQTGTIRSLTEAGLPIYGIYGMEDGLYSIAELKQLEALLGPTNFERIGNASHNVFIDQQPIFLTLIEAWAK